MDRPRPYVEPSPPPGALRWLTRYDDVVSVLRDPRFSANPATQAVGVDRSRHTPVRSLGSELLMFIDPPDHTRIRGLVSQAFTVKQAEGLRPRIQALVTTILDAVVEREDGELDVLAEVAYPLPAAVICELLGIPAADHDRFKILAAAASRLLDGHLLDPATMSDASNAGLELLRYFGELVDDRRRHLGPDLVSGLIMAEEAGDRLTQSELLTTVILILLAGFETTMNQIGNGMLALLQHPDQMARLRDDPGLLRTGVEELLRYDGPLRSTARIAITDVEIGGVTIRAREQVIASLAAANRDPDQFPDPDRVDVGRTPNRHLALSGGAHYCLGASLARVELQTVFGAIVHRFPHLELITADPTYRDHFVLRGLNELKLAWSTA